MKIARRALLVSFSGKSEAGGMERMVYYIDQYFHNRGIETKIIDEDYLIHHTFLGNIFNQLFRFRHFKKRKAIYLARYASLYLWTIDRNRYIVISQGESTPFYPSHVVFIHGCYHSMEVAYGKTERKLGRIANLQRLSCKFAKQIVVVSAKVKADIAAIYHIPPHKITVINNCVDTAKFYPVVKKTARPYTLLYVGRLEHGKGLPVLQRLAALIEQADNWQLLIACNNATNTALFSAYAKTIVKVGLNIDNITAAAYTHADLLIIPSLFEGFELVTLEALAAGIPVVGNRVGAVCELLDRKYPGIYLLEEMHDTILFSFSKIIETFKQAVNQEALHQRVVTEFGMDAYMKKLDTTLAPIFFHKSKKNNAQQIR